MVKVRSNLEVLLYNYWMFRFDLVPSDRIVGTDSPAECIDYLLKTKYNSPFCPRARDATTIMEQYLELRHYDLNDRDSICLIQSKRLLPIRWVYGVKDIFEGYNIGNPK